MLFHHVNMAQRMQRGKRKGERCTDDGIGGISFECIWMGCGSPKLQDVEQGIEKKWYLHSEG